MGAKEAAVKQGEDVVMGVGTDMDVDVDMQLFAWLLERGSANPNA